MPSSGSHMPIAGVDALQMYVHVTLAWFVLRFPPAMKIVFTGLITANDGEFKT